MCLCRQAPALRLADCADCQRVSGLLRENARAQAVNALVIPDGPWKCPLIRVIAPMPEPDELEVRCCFSAATSLKLFALLS